MFNIEISKEGVSLNGNPLKHGGERVPSNVEYFIHTEGKEIYGIAGGYWYGKLPVEGAIISYVRKYSYSITMLRNSPAVVRTEVNALIPTNNFVFFRIVERMI